MARHIWNLLLLSIALLPGCGTPGDGSGGNDNSNDTRSEVRDLSSFTVFTYDAGPLSCAELNRVVQATIVDLRDQDLGVRADLIILADGDAASDSCATAPPERGCLVLRGPQTLFLTDDDIGRVVQTFSAVQVLLDDEPQCVEERCADAFDWDASGVLSSARCAAAPRLGPSQAQAITSLLESLRSD